MKDHDNEIDLRPPSEEVPTTGQVEAVHPEPSEQAEVLPTQEEKPTLALLDTQEVDIDMGFNRIDISASQEETRAKIAWTFTQIFLFLVGLGVISPLVVSIVSPEIFPDPVEISKGLLMTISSILAGPFGFIVGFYFKQENG